MGDLNDLSRSMFVLTKTVQGGMNAMKQNVARAVTRAVVEGTPVDTGKARSNWIAGVNEDPEEIIEPHAPGMRLGRGETANAQAAIKAADEVIALAKPGDDIYLVNNVPYIETLNNGSSSQAPAGFVADAALAAHDEVVNAKPIVP